MSFIFVELLRGTCVIRLSSFRNDVDTVNNRNGFNINLVTKKINGYSQYFLLDTL